MNEKADYCHLHLCYYCYWWILQAVTSWFHLYSCRHIQTNIFKSIQFSPTWTQDLLPICFAIILFWTAYNRTHLVSNLYVFNVTEELKSDNWSFCLTLSTVRQFSSRLISEFGKSLKYFFSWLLIKSRKYLFTVPGILCAWHLVHPCCVLRGKYLHISCLCTGQFQPNEPWKKEKIL